MIKQVIALLVLSMAIIFAMPYAGIAVQWLLQAHDWISNLLVNIFSGGQAGNFVRDLIALLALPIIIALIPTLVYWLARRHWFPYFMEVAWIVWLIQVGALLAKG